MMPSGSCAACSMQTPSGNLLDGKLYCAPCFLTNAKSKLGIRMYQEYPTKETWYVSCKSCGIENNAKHMIKIDCCNYECRSCFLEQKIKGKKYLIDENLRKMNRDDEDEDCLTTLDLLPKGAKDYEVMKLARETGLTLITKDIRLTLNCVIRGIPVVFHDYHDNRHLIKRCIDDNNTTNI